MEGQGPFEALRPWVGWGYRGSGKKLSLSITIHPPNQNGTFACIPNVDLFLRNYKYNVWISCGCLHKFVTNGVLAPTKTHSLVVLEAKSPKPRSWHGPQAPGDSLATCRPGCPLGRGSIPPSLSSPHTRSPLSPGLLSMSCNDARHRVHRHQRSVASASLYPSKPRSQRKSPSELPQRHGFWGAGEGPSSTNDTCFRAHLHSLPSTIVVRQS